MDIFIMSLGVLIAIGKYVIENGFGILIGKVKHTCDGIDTPSL